MTTPYLGTYWFDLFQGAPSPAGSVLEEITRPGVEGVAFRKIGYRGEPFPARTLVTVATVLNAYDLAHEYRNLIGTTQTLIDPLGNYWYDVLVVHCRPGPPQRFSAAAGGHSGLAAGYRVSCDWLLQLTQ